MTYEEFESLADIVEQAIAEGDDELSFLPDGISVNDVEDEYYFEIWNDEHFITRYYN